MSFSRVFKLFSFKSLFLSLILILFIIGSIDYLLVYDKNRCEMTFMFQFPQFILIPLKNSITQKYPDYNLYVYGEGFYAESLRSGYLSGIPVVFVPGNRGSYKQVRSLGSVALRMSHRYETPFHLNYFSLDFNEEYSGINSFKLETQTHFLKESVIKILDLYEKRERNVSLVLIGHSIGGLIIRSLMTLPEFQPYIKRVDLILTLATPHKCPVVPIDSKMIVFYERIEKFWINKRNTDLSHINVISIGGGFNDKLVSSDLTRLQTQNINDLSIVTTAIDDVWVSTDHLCIVWCKQLVLKISRLLFDLIDENSLNVIQNKTERNEIIKYHLMNRILTKNYPKTPLPQNVFLSANGEWNQNFERNIKISKPKILKPIYILLPLIRRESIVIQFVGLYRPEWLLTCSLNNNTFCEKGETLHKYVKRIVSEPRDSERRIFIMGSHVLINKGFTHLLLALSSTIEPVNIQIDRFTTAIRSKTILMPTLIQSLTMIFSSVTVLNIAVSEETTYYNLSLNGLNDVWNAYSIRLETKSCYPSASNIGFLYFWIPWNHENQMEYIYPKKGKSSEITLKLNSPKPKEFSVSTDPVLYLLVDPNCGYELKLKPSISEIMGQILRHFGVVLMPIIVSIMLSLLSIQINCNHLNSKNICGQNSIKNKYFYESSVHLMTRFGSISFYGLLVISSASYSLHSNGITSSLTNTQIIILFSFLYLLCHSICYFFLVIISFILKIFTTLFICIQTKLKFNEQKTTQIIKKSFRLKLIPSLVLIVLLFVGITYVSAFSFVLCLLGHTIQLMFLIIKCHYIENRSGIDLNSSLWNLQLTLLVILFLSTIPTIPLLLDWINLLMPHFYYGLNDSFLLPAFLITISYPIMWHNYTPTQINENQRKYLSITLKLMSFLSSFWCQINYWNICLILSISVFVVSFQHSIELITNKNLKLD